MTSTSVAGHRRSLAPALASSIVVVAASVGTVVACARLLPGGSLWTVALVGGGAATVITFILQRLVGTRLVRNSIFATGAGLDSRSVDDRAVGPAVEREDGPGRLVRRFTPPAEALRRGRSVSSQKDLPLGPVLAASTTIAVIVDEAGRVIHANPSAEQFFAAGKKIEGKSLAALLAAGPRELQEAARAPRDLLFTLERRDAVEPETFHLSRHAFGLSTERHTLFMLKPLTKELARQEVETWKKAIRALSHEVNNSLAPITSLVHSARLMLATPATFQQRLGVALDTIEERAIHLKTFLDGYASVARLQPPARRPVPWRDLLGGVEGLYPFRLDGDPPVEPGFLDPNQMQQVLIGLLKNAAESASAPDQITLAIRVDALGGGVEIVVSDRGKGMPAAVLRNALLPFYSTTKAGTGLGLALCREIVEAHGGRLSLHPREEGGLAVHCWLPADSSSLASPASSTILMGTPAAASSESSPGPGPLRRRPDVRATAPRSKEHS